jgi:hypothetical protein
MIIQPGSSICLDECRGSPMPWMPDWLALLLTGRMAEVPLHGEFIAPRPGPGASPSLDLSKAAAVVGLEAGATRLIDVPAGTAADISVEGHGELGGEPAMAIFARNKANQWQELEPGNTALKAYRLGPGSYEVCIY